MDKRQFIFLVIIIVLILSSCIDKRVEGTPLQKTSITPDSIPPVETSTVPVTEFQYPKNEITCQDEAFLQVGRFIAENNTWGRGDTNGEQYEQCMSVSQLDVDNFMVNWSWNWPFGGGNVKAYPEIIFGNKFGRVSSDDIQLPARVDQFSEYLITFSYMEESVVGERNIAFESWLHSSEKISGTNRKYEVMVWLDRSANFYSGGEYQGDVEIDGDLYELYSAPFPKWFYIAFIRKLPVTQGQLRWNSFIEYLLKNNIIDAENTYLADIEFGTEIISGKGKFYVEKIEIVIR